MSFLNIITLVRVTQVVEYMCNSFPPLYSISLHVRTCRHRAEGQGNYTSSPSRFNEKPVSVFCPSFLLSCLFLTDFRSFQVFWIYAVNTFPRRGVSFRFVGSSTFPGSVSAGFILPLRPGALYPLVATVLALGARRRSPASSGRRCLSAFRLVHTVCMEGGGPVSSSSHGEDI